MRWAEPRAAVAHSGSEVLAARHLAKGLHTAHHLSLTQPRQHPGVQMTKGRLQVVKGFVRGPKTPSLWYKSGLSNPQPTPFSGQREWAARPTHDLAMWNCGMCTEGPLSEVRPPPHPTQLQVQLQPQILLVCDQAARVWLLAPPTNGATLRKLFSLCSSPFCLCNGDSDEHAPTGLQ